MEGGGGLRTLCWPSRRRMQMGDPAALGWARSSLDQAIA